MKLHIDRIEGEKIVAELPDGTRTILDKVVFPDAKEGDVLLVSREESDTEKRSIKAKFDKLKVEKQDGKA